MAKYKSMLVFFKVRDWIFMKKLKAYIGTSVFFGCFDPLYCKWANSFIDKCLHGKYKAFISDIVSLEIAESPEYVREKYAKITNTVPFHADVTGTVVELAESYMEHKIFERNYFLEALHFALAAVNDADMLVSCSIKNIFDFDKKLLLNSINLHHGYDVLQIFSPMEIEAHSNANHHDYADDSVALIRKTRTDICKTLRKKDDNGKLLYIRKKANEVKCLMSARIV